MAYTKDPDHATRGPGAIAALDRNSGPRWRKRIAAAQASRRRDLAMSAIAQGALGRIDTDVLTSGKRQTPVIRTPFPTAPLVKVAPTFTTPPAPAPVAVRAPVTAVSNPSAAVAPLIVKLPPAPAPPPTTVTVVTPVPISPAPTTTPTPSVAVTTGGGKPPTIVSAGGGGAGISTGGTRPVTSITPIAMPNVDAPDLNVSQGSGMSMSVILPVLGGAALALYLLTRKGKKGGP